MTTGARVPHTSRRRIATLVVAVVSALVASVGAPTTAHAAEAPVLTALTVDAHPITVDDHLTVSYTVESSVPLDSVNVAYTSPSGRLLGASLNEDPSLSGEVRIDFRDGIENGLYELTFVQVRTTWGALASYDRQDGPSGSGRHSFDFAAFDVTVAGSVYDTDAPAVSSVEVSPGPLKPGAPLEVSWSAAEAHAATELAFEFRNDTPGQPVGTEMVAVTDPAALAAGRASKPLLATALGGTYVLTRIVAEDSLGNRAAYLPDGRIVPMGGQQQWGEHELDFSLVAFEVTGSTVDVSPPQLATVTVSPRPVSYGETVHLDYSVADASPTLSTVAFHYSSPSGRFMSPIQGAPAGSAFAKSGRVQGPNAELGTWRLTRIDLADAAGNDIQLLRDGTTHSASARTDGRHAISFSALDVLVESTMTLDSVRSRPQSVEVSWSHPTWEAQDLLSFRVTVSPGGTSLTVPVSGDASYRVVVPGLTNGLRYAVAVQPEYASGLGTARRASVTPAMASSVWAAGDVDADGRNDLLARLPDGLVRLYRGSGQVTFGSRKDLVTTEGRTFPADRIDGHASFLNLSGGTALNAVHLDRSREYLGDTPVGTGWGMRFIDGSADFTGDRMADIVAVTPGGSAYLYRGYGSGRYGKGTRIATGWSTMQTVFAASDVTGDRRADLLVVDSAGVLWIHPGNGAGRFWTRRKVSSGWGGLGALFSARDVTGDGRVDLGAVTMGGTLRVYKGRGNGTFTGAVSVSSGWAPYL
jgi:hypothetical protein